MKKLTYTEVINYIETNSNCKLLSTEYINTNSDLEVLCECRNIFKVSFKHFKSNNQRQCNECSSKNRSAKLQKSHEQFCEEVYNLVKNEYIILSEYTKYHEYVKIKHNTCGYEYPVTPANFISGYRCPKCSGNIKSNTEEFKEKIFKLYGNEYDILGEYINSYTKIRVRHNICNEMYMVRPNDILSGNKCFKCSGLERKTLDIIKDEIFSLVNEEYKVDGEYKNNKSKLTFTHKLCGESFDMKINNFLNGQRCPICAESKGEQEIRKYLDKNNISYGSQKEFEGLTGVNNGSLSYDFYLPHVNTLIEYQGQFHDGSSGEYSKVNLEQQQEHDFRKRNYAKQNGYKLLEIWYYDFDNIDQILTEYLKQLNLINLE